MTKANGASGDVDVFGRQLVLKTDLRQRDVATWNRVYVARPRQATADERQASLEAAIEAGWIESPATRYEDVTVNGNLKTERRYYFDGVEVGDMLPAEVYFYGLQISRHFDAAVAVPKVSSSP